MLTHHLVLDGNRLSNTENPQNLKQYTVLWTLLQVYYLHYRSHMYGITIYEGIGAFFQLETVSRNKKEENENI